MRHDTHRPGRARAALAWIAAALVGLTLAEEPAPPGRPAGSEPPEPGESHVLVVPGASPDLVLIQTGNVVGYVEPCG